MLAPSPRPPSPLPASALAAVPAADLQRLRHDVQEVRQLMGAPLLPLDHDEPLPPIARGTARLLDDACMAFLARQPAIAQRSLRADIIASLIALAEALQAVESASTPLGLALLQMLRESDDELRALHQRVLGLLQLPPDTVLADGLTVAEARRLLPATCQAAGLAADPGAQGAHQDQPAARPRPLAARRLPSEHAAAAPRKRRRPPEGA